MSYQILSDGKIKIAYAGISFLCECGKHIDCTGEVCHCACHTGSVGGSEGVRVPEGSEGVRVPEGSEGVRVPEGSEGVRVPEGSEGVRVPEGSGGVGVFCKNLLRVPSWHRLMCQVGIGRCAKLAHPYNIFFYSFIVFLIIIRWEVYR